MLSIELDASLGGLAQLARAPALHAGGQRFESVILHKKRLDKRFNHCSFKLDVGFTGVVNARKIESSNIS